MSNRSNRSGAARRQAARSRRRIYNMTAHRLREIERIIRHRHGVVPDTDDAGIYLEQVACCLAHMLWKKSGKPEFADLLERLSLWCDLWAPEVSIKIQRDVVKRAIRQSRLGTADECAAKLRLSYAERTQLRITTIGACDVSKRRRKELYKERKRARDRERAAKNRTARGTMSRDKYRATSLSRTQPWKADGISRRTWERRRRGRDDAATPSPSSTSYMLGDRAASAPASEVLPRQSSSSQRCSNERPEIRGVANARPVPSRAIMLTTDIRPQTAVVTAAADSRESSPNSATPQVSPRGGDNASASGNKTGGVNG